MGLLETAVCAVRVGSCSVMSEGCAVRWGGTRGGVLGWVPGGCYTGYYPAVRLVLPGPNQWYIPVYRAPQALRGPGWASPHTCSSPCLSWPYGRDSINNILKLVKTLECRLKSLMRPGILPVSKRLSKVTTLNFPDFHIRGPSLTRNKWSDYDLGL